MPSKQLEIIDLLERLIDLDETLLVEVDVPVEGQHGTVQRHPVTRVFIGRHTVTLSCLRYSEGVGRLPFPEDPNV